MAYFGPTDRARQYFIDMGYVSRTLRNYVRKLTCTFFSYEPANRQTTADFLVSVTNPNGRIPRAGVTALPRTSAEFAEYFKRSQLGHANRADMDSYQAEFVGKKERASAFIQSAQDEHAEGCKKKR
jgi:ATP-binding cassette subfamily G (WHITE) protein 2 (SNQ2)